MMSTAFPSITAIDGNGIPHLVTPTPVSAIYSDSCPLHPVALTLIEWLQSTFDVDVEQTRSAAMDLINVPDDVVQTVRIVPRNPDAAPLAFVLTGFPTVHLHAGLLQDFHFPSCACDACDEDLTSTAEDLEWTVRTIVAGGYSERFSPLARPLDQVQA